MKLPNKENVGLLKQSLINTAQSDEIKEVMSSPHGVKYTIDGEIQTPSGGVIKMRTVWIINKGQSHPRFVTAYPL